MYISQLFFFIGSVENLKAHLTRMYLRVANNTEYTSV